MTQVRGITIRSVLRGMQTGRMQTVGRMQVIPLVGDPDLFDERFAAPTGTKASVGTSDYGKMVFKNDNPDKVLLVPCHVGYVVKQQAQNHAMVNAGLVDKGRQKTFSNAACIQESQGGYMDQGDHTDDMIILPYALRENALAKRRGGEYGKIWDDISEFNRSMDVPQDRNGHLELFLGHYQKQLDEFVAEFEIVPGQTGAIILVNGQVVGVERAPSPEFWRSVWKPLIRECYGSLAIKAAKDARREGDDPSRFRVPLRMTGINTLEDLEEAIDEARDAEEGKAKEIVRKLLDEEFDAAEEAKLDEFGVVTVSNEQFKGQVVRDGEKIPYASLFTTADWAKKAPWVQANEFAL